MLERRTESVTRSLTEAVYQRLRQEILSCALAPGAEVYEGELAARYQVSKTPVREALNTLRQEGFVRVSPRRGYQIAPITVKDLSELFALRALIEGEATELAARYITDRELDQLARLAAVTYKRGERPNTRRFVQANREFHCLLAAASRNSRYLRLVEQCLDQLERAFTLRAGVRNINDEVHDDHLVVVDALRARNGALARALMVEQIERTHQYIVSTIFDPTAEGFSQHVLSHE